MFGIVLFMVGFAAFYIYTHTADFELKLYEAAKEDDLEKFVFYEKLGANWRNSVEPLDEHNMVTWISTWGSVNIFKHLVDQGFNQFRV